MTTGPFLLSHVSKDALKTLATLNRMSYVNAPLFLFQLKRAELELTSGEMERGCQILTMEVRQMIPRIFLINFFQRLREFRDYLL